MVSFFFLKFAVLSIEDSDITRSKSLLSAIALSTEYTISTDDKQSSTNRTANSLRYIKNMVVFERQKIILSFFSQLEGSMKADSFGLVAVYFIVGVVTVHFSKTNVFD